MDAKLPAAIHSHVHCHLLKNEVCVSSLASSPHPLPVLLTRYSTQSSRGVPPYCPHCSTCFTIAETHPVCPCSLESWHRAPAGQDDPPICSTSVPLSGRSVKKGIHQPGEEEEAVVHGNNHFLNTTTLPHRRPTSKLL